MTTENPASATLEMWREWIGKSSEFWGRLSRGAEPQTVSEAWRDFLAQWSASWFKALSQQGTPEIAQAGQKLWMEQIEAWAQVLAKVMNTEAFAELLGRSLTQVLTQTQRAREVVGPQIDSALWQMNLPSRGQVERLAERVVGLEERLDDLEAQNRAVLKEIRGLAARLSSGPAEPRKGAARERRKRAKSS